MSLPLVSAGGDHPRMRGDKRQCLEYLAKVRGSPPHARGQVSGCEHVCKAAGITPACAGTSTPMNARGLYTKDHPRMRGDKYTQADTQMEAAGSPPHARGQASVKGVSFA